MHVEVLGKSCGGAATRTLVGEKVKSLLFSINCRWGRSLFFKVGLHIKIDIILNFDIFVKNDIFIYVDIYINY